MKVVILMDGGLVQDVIYKDDDDSELNVIVLDSDTDGLEDEDIMTIDDVDYFVSTVDPINNVDEVDNLFKKVLARYEDVEYHPNADTEVK